MSEWFHHTSKTTEGILWNADTERPLIVDEDPAIWRSVAEHLVEGKETQGDLLHALEKLLHPSAQTGIVKGMSALADRAWKEDTLPLRRFLGEMADALLVKGAILLPMAKKTDLRWALKNSNTPDSAKVLEAELRSRVAATVPEKYAASTVRLLLGFARIPQASALGPEGITFLYNTPFYKDLNAGYKSAFSHTLKAIDDVAVSGNPGRKPLIVSSRRINTKPTLSDQSAWWFCDADHGSASLVAWRDAYAKWFLTIRSKNIRAHAYASRRFSNYLRSRKVEIVQPSNFARADAVPTAASTEPSLVEWMSEQGFTDIVIGETLSSVRKFFDWWGDAQRDPSIEDWQNPVQYRDRKAYGGSELRLNKSNKTVLPKRIIEMAKQVIQENDYAFPHSINRCYVRSRKRQDRNEKRIFSPVLPVCILTLLTLPVRGLQARLLDSGEADEHLVFPDGRTEPNTLPLAQPKRSVGVLQPMGTGPFQTGGFVGFRITTNKTAVQSDGIIEMPYDIPWHDRGLQDALAMVRDWQMQHNPATKLLTRRDVQERAARIDGAFARLPSYAFLFRDPNADDPLQPVTREQLASFWCLVLKEVQKRLRADGMDVSLVDEVPMPGNQQPRLTTKFPLHSLRVSGITHFVEAGVPLHILAEFVAGHSQLLMTLYYTKIDDVKVRDVLNQAAAQMESHDDAEALEAIRALGEDAWGESFVGGPDARQAAIGNDTGTWHIDVDGICPVGRSRCHEGGEPIRENGRIQGHTPIAFNTFNCALCRFRLTGPAFLQGQVTVFNAALHALREKAQSREKIDGELTQAKAAGSARKTRTLGDRLDRLDAEIGTIVQALGRRFSHIHASQSLLKRGVGHTFLTGLDGDELAVVLRDASEWEALDFAAQTSSFFPEMGTASARFRKGMLLDRVIQANGLNPLFLSLAPDMAAEAANRLTALLDDMVGPQKVRDLIEYRTTLEDLGLASGFQAMVDQSISLAQSSPLLLTDQRP